MICLTRPLKSFRVLLGLEELCIVSLQGNEVSTFNTIIKAVKCLIYA